MGLNASHNAFDGSYGGFDNFRTAVATCIGIDYQNVKTIDFNKIKEHNLFPLLSHSDCDGELTPDECKRIAAGLKEILPIIDLEYKDAAQTFIDGCELAISENENIEFG